VSEHVHRFRGEVRGTLLERTGPKEDTEQAGIRQVSLCTTHQGTVRHPTSSREQAPSPRILESRYNKINTIAHHFDHNIKIAIITRGITKHDELLIFLAQWDEVTR
jgi:hypothetical protein